MLTGIEIQGYKSIRELNLPLGDINLLIGANGAGKSNFLSFFKLIYNMSRQRLRNYSMSRGADDLLYYGRKRTKKIVGEIRSEDDRYRFVLQPRDDNSLFLDSESHFEKNSAVSFSNQIESTVARHFSEFRVYHFHDTTISSPLRSNSQVNDNRFLAEDGSNLPSFLYLLQLKEPKAYRRIETVIKSVMPYFEGFDLAPQAIDGKIELVWHDIDNPDKAFFARHLSDGSIRFIALATLLLQPQLPSIVLIDEPELGLHPVAIETLSGMIKSAAARGCQVIVSTQSVGLINEFSPEDVITVDRKDGQSVFQRLDKVRLQQWLEDYSMGDLWCKCVINGQPTLL